MKQVKIRQVKVIVLSILSCLTMSMGFAQSIDINVINGHPSVFLWVQQIEETFIPAVDEALEETDYSIEWSTFFGGSLAAVGGELEAIEAGLAEVGVVPSVFEPSALPLQNVTYVAPFGSPDPRTVLMIMNQLHQSIPAMTEAYEAVDMVYLGGGFSLDNYFLMSTFPVNSLADLEGKKIGAPGPAVNWLDGTGAVGVSGNLTTYYNDIQTGLYDGVITFGTAAAPAKLQEVAPYISQVDFGAQYAGSLVANKDWFEGQPSKIQEALKLGAEAYSRGFAAALIANTNSALTTMIEDGAILIEAPAELRIAWAASLDNVPQLWATELDDKDIPGSEVLGTYMQALRDSGLELPRNWDKE